jgi:hypothetical protein
MSKTMKNLLSGLIILSFITLILISCKNENETPAKEEVIEVITEEILEHIIENPGDFFKYNAIERDYDWFINQYDTGEYSFNNCGPACAVMAAKWCDKDFAITVEEARNRNIQNTNDSDNKWWYISTIAEFFNSENIPHEIHERINYNDVMKQLNMGNIMIVPVHMRYIKQNNFSLENEHFIIIK